MTADLDQAVVALLDAMFVLCVSTSLLSAIIAINGTRFFDWLVDKLPRSKAVRVPLSLDLDGSGVDARQAARVQWETMRRSQTYAGAGEQWFLGYTQALYLLDLVTEHEWMSVQVQAGAGNEVAQTHLR